MCAFHEQARFTCLWQRWRTYSNVVTSSITQLPRYYHVVFFSGKILAVIAPLDTVDAFHE